MARILGLFPAALTAARHDMSANAFAREIQSQGLGARRSEVLQLYRIARGVVARNEQEPFRPQQSVPSGDEIGQWPVKNPNGITQTVTITYRDRTTGQIKQTWWSTVTPNGITRERAVAEAIDAYSEHAESYEQDLIGAVHTSAYQQVEFP
jgi:hypothetical protein